MKAAFALLLCVSCGAAQQARPNPWVSDPHYEVFPDAVKQRGIVSPPGVTLPGGDYVDAQYDGLFYPPYYEGWYAISR